MSTQQPRDESRWPPAESGGGLLLVCQLGPLADLLERGAIDRRAIDALAASLGLTPAARSRLGLELTTAERAALDVERVLGSMYSEEDT